MHFFRQQSFQVIDSLEKLIEILKLIFDCDDIDVDLVQNVLLSYNSNPFDWEKYAHFDRLKYTRNLVDSGNGKYNLMLICWSEGQGSSIHDHSNAHCFMKILSGSLTEKRYEWPDSEKCNKDDNYNEMKVLEENELRTNDVAYMSDSIGLHKVENRSHTFPAVSLHLYCPPYSKCHSFDERTGQKTRVKVTFHSKYGNEKTFMSKQFRKLHELGIDWQF